ECNSKHENIGLVDGDILTGHELDDAVSDMNAHVVVDLAPGKNDLGVIAEAFRLMRQVIRVDTNAVPPNEAGAEGKKIPFRSCRLKYFVCIDADAIKDQRQLVHESNINVALRVL